MRHVEMMRTNRNTQTRSHVHKAEKLTERLQTDTCTINKGLVQARILPLTDC